MSKSYVVFWKEDDHQKLKAWWESLNKNPGWRAQLRRAESPTDVLLCQGFRFLTLDLSRYWINDQNVLGLAAVAGVLAHVKTYDTKSFAAACATPPQPQGKPVMSELRFAHLQKSRTLEELYIRFIRAVHLLQGVANPISIADSILQWNKEMVYGELEAVPRERILVRWGFEYFQNLQEVNK